MSMQDLIAAILARIESSPKVKLAKLVLFAERLAYKRHGESLTGTYFVRQPMGPVPANFDAILAEGASHLWNLRCEPVHIITEEITRNEHRYYPLANPALDSRSQRIIEDVISDYGSLSGSALSQKSHDLPAWRYAEPGAPIFIEELALDTDEQYYRFLDIVSGIDDCADDESLPTELSSLLSAPA